MSFPTLTPNPNSHLGNQKWCAVLRHRSEKHQVSYRKNSFIFLYSKPRGVVLLQILCPRQVTSNFLTHIELCILSLAVLVLYHHPQNLSRKVTSVCTILLQMHLKYVSENSSCSGLGGCCLKASIIFTFCIYYYYFYCMFLLQGEGVPKCVCHMALDKTVLCNVTF